MPFGSQGLASSGVLSGVDCTGATTSQVLEYYKKWKEGFSGEIIFFRPFVRVVFEILTKLNFFLHFLFKSPSYIRVSFGNEVYRQPDYLKGCCLPFR